MLKSVCFIWFLLYALTATLKAQGFYFQNPKQKSTSISFKLSNNLIIIPLLLNEDKDTLNFVLDTGVGHTLFTDSSFIQKLQLDTAKLRKIIVKGGGIGEVIPTYVVPMQQLHIGSLIAPFQNILIVSKSLSYLSQYAGIKIDGIVGYDFFRNLTVKIDYQRKELQIFQPDFFEKKYLKNYETQNILRLHLQRQKPYIKAFFSNENNDTIAVKLLLDTGAGHSVSLDLQAEKGIFLPKKHIESTLGLAVNGLVIGKIGRLPSVKIGHFTWKNVVCSFPDSSLVAFRKENVEKDGSIGIGILERFTLVLDYSKERCIFEPNSKFNKNFDIGFSGIEIASDAKNYYQYFVVGIHPLSQAYQAGLQIGDEIFSINNIIASRLTIGQVYELLDAVENRLIQMLVKREGSFHIVTFRTKRFI
ncbi:MAG: aspartyl protease family protein [Raineya sp.]